MKPYYEQDGITIYCGDCREILPQLPKVDLVLTDPPYGVGRDKGFGGFRGFGGSGEPIPSRIYDDDWDYRPDKELMGIIANIAGKVIIFGGNFFELPIGSHWIVWDKLNTMPTFGDCELAWTNIKRNSIKKYTVEYNGLLGKEIYRFHPTQKPVRLFARIIADYSEPSDLILDPFLGSGTTAYCAKKLNRKCIGIEIEEKYCEIAANRCRQMVFDFKETLRDTKQVEAEFGNFITGYRYFD